MVPTNTPSRAFRPFGVLAGLTLSLVSVLGATRLVATSFPTRPGSAEYYVDEAELIDARIGAALNAIGEALWREERVPLTVVTIASLVTHEASDLTIEEYATRLFDRWGIGSSRRNYGMLLLVSRDDRRARIELGAGWGQGHDRQAQQIMDELIIPEFKAGRYGEGLLGGARGLNAMARGLDLPTPKAAWWLAPTILVTFVFLMATVISLFRSGRYGWGWAVVVATGLGILFLLRAAVSSGAGRFSGGTSGGGGASGSW